MSVITPKNKLSQNEYHAKHGLKKLAKNSLYISLMFGQVLWPMNSAMAAPVFIPGNGVEHTGSNEYTVTDNRAIARWQSFVLGEAETIKFLNQDGIENSILLNLVTSEIGSKIAGELNANNIQFILVDPSGITVANSAKIDVSGLVLSTVGVSETEQGGFKKNKNLLFDSSSNEKIVLNPDANIVLESDATLNLNNKLENVVLIGKDIQNNANIEASGLVAMLATDKATLNFEGSNTLGVSFNALALIDDANFVNNGTIIADRAFLASLAKNQAININKDIKANQIVISGDKIELSAGLSSNGSGSSLKIGKGVTNFNGQNLTAATELTLKKNDAVIQEMPSSEIQVKKLIVSAEATAFNSAQTEGNHKASLNDFGIVEKVEQISFEHNNGGLTTSASANLETDKHALTTQNITFTGINKADLQNNTLTASTAQNSFNVTGSKALTAADINFTEVASVTGNSNQGHVITNADANLAADKHALTSQNIIFTGIGSAALGGNKLTASTEQNSFNVTGSKALTAADIEFTGVTSVTGDNNLGHVDTNADANLEAGKYALTTQDIAFTGIGSAALGGNKLTASTEQNSFNVTGSKALTAADIDFTEVASVTGNSNQGHVITNADANLEADKHALTTQNITFTGINKADLQNNTLTASTEQNSFNVTGSKALTASDINFTGVTSVAGDNNLGHVDTNADANLETDKHALTTQGIGFTDIGSMDLNGQSLIGSEHDDSFQILVDGVKANGIKTTNLNRTINANGAVTLSGAQNNIWQLMDMKGELKDSRDNGFIFIGVNAANLQCETLNASAAQNKFDITGAQKLTAADIDFSNVAEVNAYDNKGYVITNNVAELTDGKNQLKTQWVIINGVDQAYLSNNALKGSATGSTLELISESRVDASGIKFFDFGELDGYENTGALVSKLDAPQWTMTTANSGTVNNINFKAFKTLENSVGDLKLNVGEKVGGVEFKGDNLNFGGNSSLVFNSQNNVTVNSINNINGSLVAKDLNINTTGDVDLKTQIDSITLNANNANLVQEGDLVIHSIDVGRTLNLNSADAGKNNLIAGNSGRINVKAKASLGEQGKWDNIGVNAQPLSFEVVSELALVANTTVAPIFPNGQPPIFNLEGDRSESLLSSHTNALIQNNRVSNDANANLALFEALSPIYIDKNAVAGVHVKDSRLDVLSELEMEMFAVLLSKENPTAAGKPNKKKVLEKDDADET